MVINQQFLNYGPRRAVLAGYWDGAISRRVPERGLAAFWSGETGSWAGIWGMGSGMVVKQGTEQVGKLC